MADALARAMIAGDRLYGSRQKAGRIAALGDSITAGLSDPANGSMGPDWFSMAIAQSGGKLRYVYNAGIGGNTTAQMLARIQTDIVAYRPAMCTVLGGTNDVGQGVSLLTTRVNLETIIQVLSGAGIMPILATIPPRNDATMLTAIAKVNFHVRDLAAKYNLIVLDFHSALVDPSTGQYKAGYASDGVHPTIAGYKVMATVVNNTLGPLLPPGSAYLPSWNSVGINLTQNGLCLIDANLDGVPDSWIAYGAGATHSLVADAAILGQWAKMDKTSAPDLKVLEQTISTGWAVGDHVAFAGRFNTVAEAGAFDCSVKLQFNGSGKRLTPVSSWKADTASGSFYMEGTIPAGTTSLLVQTTGSTGTGSISVAQVGVVNLTQLGL